MLASELFARSLRLINEPGRGAKLQAGDTTAALEALQEILDSEAVSKQFVPGIRRHFFNLQQAKSIYSYGASAQADLRSDDFDDDPAPIKIEGAYIREGSSITDNEVVDEYRLENLGSWVLAGGSVITNNALSHELVVATSTQPLAGAPVTAVTKTYTIRINMSVFAGTVEVRLRDSAVTFETYVLDSTGVFEFDFVFPTVVAPDIQIATLLATDDVSFASISIIERGKERLELPDSQGSDYTITPIDQIHYNRRFSKGTGGRPYEILYSRAFPISEIRFDNSAIAGDILVLDVLVNRVQITAPESVIRLLPDAIKWVRYSLADALAGEYGKMLNPRQIRIMEDAWNKLAAGNRRMNTLGVDLALRLRPTFDINRGDP